LIWGGGKKRRTAFLPKEKQKAPFRAIKICVACQKGKKRGGDAVGGEGGACFLF